MTKLEDDAQGKFIGDAPMGPPPAKAGRGTCPECQSPEWVRIETREQIIRVYADETAVPQEVEESLSLGPWACRNGHPLESTVLAELFDTAMDFGEPIGV